MEGAWEVFDAMRTGQIPEHRPDGKHIVPVEPDAVTFTAMIMACAYRDDFEQSRALLLDMKQSAIESTLSVHNALINACASRAHSLANLGKAKKNQLQRSQKTRIEQLGRTALHAARCLRLRCLLE